MDEKKTFSIKIFHRPWYEWVIWGIWFVVEVFFLQDALASAGEYEPRANLLFWVIFAVLLVVGVIVWFMRRARLAR